MDVYSTNRTLLLMGGGGAPVPIDTTGSRTGGTGATGASDVNAMGVYRTLSAVDKPIDVALEDAPGRPSTPRPNPSTPRAVATIDCTSPQSAAPSRSERSLAMPPIDQLVAAASTNTVATRHSFSTKTLANNSAAARICVVASITAPWTAVFASAPTSSVTTVVIGPERGPRVVQQQCSDNNEQ